MRTTVVCRISAAFFSTIFFGSTVSFAAEPEEIGIPYIIEDTSGKLLSLERQRVNSGMKLKALGFGGGSMVVRFNGRSSVVRVPSKNLKFVVRFASMPPTPSAVINVDVLESKKNARELVMGRVRPMGIGARSTMGESEVALKFLPSTNSTLTFEPVTPFQPGEYVLTFKDNTYAFLFAVSQ